MGLDILVENVQLKNSIGEGYKEAITEELKNLAKEESRKLTDQSKANDSDILLNTILPHGTDLDNDQVYGVDTGDTIRDISYEGDK